MKDQVFYDNLGNIVKHHRGSEWITNNPPSFPVGTGLYQGEQIPCFTEDWTPIKCPWCAEDGYNHGGELYTRKPTATVSGIVSEEDIICNDCGKLITRWAYGSFEPFSRDGAFTPENIGN